MKAKKLITEEDIQIALNKFVQEGGLIKQLPDQVVPKHTLVGARWSAFEIITDSASPTPSATIDAAG